jgi:hypothetical protein
VAVGVMTNDIMRHFDRAREGLSTADVRCTRSVGKLWWPCSALSYRLSR